MLFQQDHIDRYEQTGGDEGHEWQPGVYALIMHTTGRSSGQLRKFAVIYRKVDGEYVVLASRGGADTHPNWYLNLVAHPDVSIQVGPQLIDVHARTVDGDERDRLWALMVDGFPQFAEYQANTERQIPVVAFTPKN
jgi:deazaflavin-dependent oxidoreductase (nitroreductase family)